MCARWPVGPMRRAMACRHAPPMHAEVIRGITIRPLRKGEREVVQSVFDGLGPRSRLLRFGGAKTALSAADLDALTLVDADHHVLVALVRRHADRDRAPRPRRRRGRGRVRGRRRVAAPRRRLDPRRPARRRRSRGRHRTTARHDARRQPELVGIDAPRHQRADHAHRRGPARGLRPGRPLGLENHALPRLEDLPVMDGDVIGQVEHAGHIAARVGPDPAGTRQRNRTARRRTRAASR